MSFGGVEQRSYNVVQLGQEAPALSGYNNGLWMRASVHDIDSVRCEYGSSHLNPTQKRNLIE